jgi:hypothetical protein
MEKSDSNISLNPANAEYARFRTLCPPLAVSNYAASWGALLSSTQRATKSSQGVPSTRNTSRQKTVVKRPSR